MPPATPSLARTLVVLALCAFVYLFVFPHYPRINNPNENVRLYMTAALVEEGSYRIDSMRARWGWVNDAAVREGHYYSVKAPGTSFLGVPGYALYRALAGDRFDRTEALWASRVTGSILPTLLFLFFFHRWLGRRTAHPPLRDLVFLSVAFGSVLLGYAYLFASHATVAACAFGAFMVLYEARRRQDTGWLAAASAGLLAAAATLFEYPALLASVLLSGYALFAIRPWSRLTGFVAGALVPTLAMMHFQWRAFGSPFRPGHLYVENPAFRAGHEEGFFGATTVHPEALHALAFDYRLGLFALSPLLLLAAPGFLRLLARRSDRLDALVALAISGAMYLAICSMNIWHAGWSIGPRYLTLLIPFLAWAALAALDSLAARWPSLATTVALGGALTGFVAAGVPSLYYPHLPPGLDRPLPQLFRVLIAHDYAPHNALQFLGIYGTVSMVPVAITLVLAIVLALGRSFSPSRSSVILVGGSLLAALALAPQVQNAPDSSESRAQVAFITRTWSPVGRDRAAKLHDALVRGEADSIEYGRLAAIYRAEGRDAEAAAAERAATRARPSAIALPATK